MFKRDYLLSGCLFAMGLGISSGAMACSTGGWDFTTATGVETGSPAPAPTTGGIARVQELCGLSLTGPGYVEDNSPIDAEDARIRLRFYVLVATPDSATQEVTMLRAFEDDAGSSEAFTISYQTSGDNMISFNPTGGTAKQVAAATTGWNLIEVDWTAGGTLRYWVNAEPGVNDDDPTDSTNAGSAAKVGMVRLGAPDGIGEMTKLYFDSYQANRSNPVRGLLVGDATGNGTVNTTDAVRILNEQSVGGTLSVGQPDCTMNGTVNTTDAVCVLNLATP